MFETQLHSLMLMTVIEELGGRVGGVSVTPLCSGKGYICAHLFGG